IIPDIQTIGKALGGRYQPIAGVLANHQVVNALEKGSSYTTLNGISAFCLMLMHITGLLSMATPTKATLL
ncbi:hypothetical protein B0T25DRAFT_431427, partial [Lasiosphaeria hispida]